MKKLTAGFSLIEVMVVVAIVGLLTAIAYPSYQAMVFKSNRSDAKVVLNDIAQKMQRCFTVQNTFKPAANLCTVVDQVTSEGGITSPEGFYNVTLADANHSTASYVLEATAVEGTRQENDTACKTFTLNQAGVKAATNHEDEPNTDECWK